MKAAGLFLFVLLVASAASAADDAAQPANAPAAPAAGAPAAPAPIAAPAPATATPAVAAPVAAVKTPEKPAVAAPVAQAPANAVAAPAKPVAPAAEPPAAPAPKPLEACAAKIQPVADAYQQAHDGFVAWLRAASDKMVAADEKFDGIKAQIADKEAAITKAKLDASAAAGIADLQKQDQALWTELKGEQANRAALCRALARAAQQKIRELNQTVLDAAAKIEP